MICLFNKTNCCTQNGVFCTIYVYKYRKQSIYGDLETHLPCTKYHNPLKFKVKGLHCNKMINYHVMGDQNDANIFEKN